MQSEERGCVHWQQESLANAKVSARQLCVYEGPLAKKYMANQRKELVWMYVSPTVFKILKHFARK